MARPTRSVAGNADGSSPGELSFRQAEAALELCLAQLQASDLDVESMADLYQRARGYADRCEAILKAVEQEVMRWDPEQPDEPPHPYEP